LLLPLSILLLLNATTATAISTLSLRDALPISGRHRSHRALLCPAIGRAHDGRCSHRLRLSHIAGEFSHIRCRRAEYDFLRRPDLDDGPVLHDRDPTRKPDRLVEIMRDEHNGLLQQRLQADDLDLALTSDQRIEMRKRFIEETEFRIDRQRTRNAQALLLNA